MKRFRNSKAIKVISLFVAINFLTELIYPTLALALTSGPNSPEFSTFTPVATTDMVNLSTGDFNYNLPVLQIPGGEGGGYALSLSYDSNVSVEQESSWVGFGWSLNPGSINRSLRGIPDDFNGENTIKTYNKTRPNWTTAKTFNTGIEAFSISAGYDESLRYNNFYGFMSTTGFGLGVKGISAHVSFDANGIRFSGAIDPRAMLAKPSKKTDKSKEKTKKNIKFDFKDMKVKMPDMKIQKLSLNLSSYTNTDFGINFFSPASYSRPTNHTHYFGYGFTRSFSLQINPSPVPVGLEIGVTSSFNVQSNQYVTHNNSYGFFYLGNILVANNHAANQRSDYFIEKGGDFNRRDKYLGIPFSTPDYFNVSGEGISGSFRAFHKDIGHLLPTSPAILNDDQFNMKTGALGVEIMAGLNFGVGTNISFGRKRSNLSQSWLLGGELIKLYSSKDELVLRFKNDKGGLISYGDDAISKVDLEYTPFAIPMLRNVDFVDSEPSPQRIMNNENSSTFIGWNSGVIGIDYERTLHGSSYGIPNNAIKDYSIVNDNGLNYVYGQPVFCRNTSNIAINIDPESDEILNDYIAFADYPLCVDGTGNYTINEEALSEFNETNRFTTIQGEISNAPYANEFLLTSIRSDTYIDITGDGPSEDDFGAWTKFSYRDKNFGDEASPNYWYRYRTPYEGLLYSKNNISDQKDDMGYAVTGEKEVYYLEVIETNTHIAFFVTNKYVHNTDKYGNYNSVYLTASGNERYDGRSAANLTGDSDPSSLGHFNGDKKETEYLEKIVLFSKNNKNTPLQTVNFQYDYSLIKNTPNNSKTGIDYNNSGRLTLKKVWMEYNGVTSAKISPYQFEYQYKTKDEINDDTYNSQWFPQNNDFPYESQNPPYLPNLLNPWGALMEYGVERDNKQIPYIYQGENIAYGKDNVHFPQSWRNSVNVNYKYDPAAWTLKQIILPSGGEIHIQYESDDYNYVQNREVMSMAGLLAYDNKSGIEPSTDPKYYINLDDLGVPQTIINDCILSNGLVDELKDYRDQLKSFFGLGESDQDVDRDKIFFKFLFDLYGNSPSLNSPTSEYITGYANVKEIEFEILHIGTHDYPSFYFTLGAETSQSGGKAETPEEAAYDLYANQRQGMLNEPEFNEIENRQVNIDQLEEDIMDVIGNVSGINNKFDKTFLKEIGKELIDNMPMPFQHNIKHEGNVCLNLCPELSYLKLPLYGSKRGGGTRVHRLLMYDKGIGNYGEEVVYGTEYRYVLEDGITSSGVASNEPIREENPLVTYMKRGNQSKLNRLIAGEDEKQYEGPIGESLLPNPSVIYSRVITSNIHKGNEGTGFVVTEFYTTKDYPYDFVRYDGEGGSSASAIDLKYDYIYLPLGIINYKMDKLWMSQGFRFFVNNMNGVFKSETKYAGSYPNSMLGLTSDIQNAAIVAMTKVNYFEPGEKIKVYSIVDDELVEQNILPGEEMDISMEKKRLDDFALDVTLEMDVSFGYPPISIYPIIALPPTISIDKTSSSMYSITKVIDYPVIQKSTETLVDNVYTKTVVHAFDKYSGRPILTSVNDDYYGLELAEEGGTNTQRLFTLTFPASWMYSSMGQKSSNILYRNNLNSNFAEYKFYADPSTATSDLIAMFLSGSTVQPDHVISSNVITYSQGWGTKMIDNSKLNAYYDGAKIASALNSLNDVWRVENTYTYNSPSFENSTVIGNDPDKRNYNSGWYRLSLFDKNNPVSNGWVRTSTIKVYSPNGDPLQELNAIDINSAAIYGIQYGNHLPVMVAQNAKYGEIYFNDFEGSVITGPNGLIAHSGQGMYKITNGGGSVLPPSMITNSGNYLIKFWSNADIEQNGIQLTVNDQSPKKIARVGQWTLYEVESSFTGGYNISINYVSPEDVYIDDLRIQPVNSQAACFVYDVNTYKLLAQFDDQHFGIFYQYNAEGQLVRKIIETEKGRKTIQETQYNTKTVARIAQ